MHDPRSLSDGMRAPEGFDKSLQGKMWQDSEIQIDLQLVCLWLAKLDAQRESEDNANVKLRAV